MSRPRFSFRPNLQNEEHRKAWDILQSVPEGQRNTFIARAILENVRQDTLENTLRRVLSCASSALYRHTPNRLR